MTRPAVRIAYCADCGYDGQAIDLARALLTDFGHGLSSVTILPWDNGTFDVSVNGQIVHSMARDGGFPETGTIAEAVRAQIALAGAGGD